LVADVGLMISTLFRAVSIAIWSPLTLPFGSVTVAGDP